MNPMIFATLRRVPRAAALVALAFLAGGVACQPKEKPKRGDRNERPLDGMERAAARNVSIETATIAMADGDLKKLKMLDVYVRNRAETALLSEDDLASLGLAIECLEGKRTKAERVAAFEKIKTGKLRAPAHDACLEENE